MAFSRYKIDNRINGGDQLGTAQATFLIRNAIANGSLPIAKILNTTGHDRLDSIAGVVYGDAKYWWVLAAASGIGWGMQVPPNTVINVPDLKYVERLVG